jgi:hypothetical protein
MSEYLYKSLDSFNYVNFVGYRYANVLYRKRLSSTIRTRSTLIYSSIEKYNENNGMIASSVQEAIKAREAVLKSYFFVEKSKEKAIESKDVPKEDIYNKLVNSVTLDLEKTKKLFQSCMNIHDKKAIVEKYLGLKFADLMDKNNVDASFNIKELRNLKFEDIHRLWKGETIGVKAEINELMKNIIKNAAIKKAAEQLNFTVKGFSFDVNKKDEKALIKLTTYVDVMNDTNIPTNEKFNVLFGRMDENQSSYFRELIGIPKEEIDLYLTITDKLNPTEKEEDIEYNTEEQEEEELTEGLSVSAESEFGKAGEYLNELEDEMEIIQANNYRLTEEISRLWEIKDRRLEDLEEIKVKLERTDLSESKRETLKERLEEINQTIATIEKGVTKNLKEIEENKTMAESRYKEYDNSDVPGHEKKLGEFKKRLGEIKREFDKVQEEEKSKKEIEKQVKEILPEKVKPLKRQLEQEKEEQENRKKQKKLKETKKRKTTTTTTPKKTKKESKARHAQIGRLTDKVIRLSAGKCNRYYDMTHIFMLKNLSRHLSKAKYKSSSSTLSTFTDLPVGNVNIITEQTLEKADREVDVYEIEKFLNETSLFSNDPTLKNNFLDAVKRVDPSTFNEFWTLRNSMEVEQFAVNCGMKIQTNQVIPQIDEIALANFLFCKRHQWSTKRNVLEKRFEEDKKEKVTQMTRNLVDVYISLNPSVTIGEKEIINIINVMIFSVSINKDHQSCYKLMKQFCHDRDEKSLNDLKRKIESINHQNLKISLKNFLGYATNPSNDKTYLDILQYVLSSSL